VTALLSQALSSKVTATLLLVMKKEDTKVANLALSQPSLDEELTNVVCAMVTEIVVV
jgi:hypothetical protein